MRLVPLTVLNSETIIYVNVELIRTLRPLGDQHENTMLDFDEAHGVGIAENVASVITKIAAAR
jgi:hypothetical protein